MRGGPIHNLLLDLLEREFRARGAFIRREYPASVGGQRGYVDLFATFGSERIAVEAELSADRAGNDVRKAVAVEYASGGPTPRVEGGGTVIASQRPSTAVSPSTRCASSPRPRA